MDTPKRGQIWLVNLDPTIGGEIRKTRPALVISNDFNNQYAATVTVIPISDQGKEVYPFEVYLPATTMGITKNSKIKCQQIRTVDKSRLIKILGTISKVAIEQTEQALRIHLGMDIFGT